MTRSENDLRAALRDLEQRADQQGAPSTASLLGRATEARPMSGPHGDARRFPRWLAPAAAAAAVAATAITAVALTNHHNTTTPAGASQRTALTSSTQTHHRPSASASVSRTVAPNDAASVLEDAAAKLDAAPWTEPAPQDFFYVRTNEATTWTSVSGTQEGDGRTADGGKIWVSGCANGHIVSGGESGDCTLNDVPHYRPDAPTSAGAWDAYLQQMAPGAKAADAQGKIIVGVLHQDLIAPKAAAALLRYLETCPGLKTVAVAPVNGAELTGVTCTSMISGSYGLVFDDASHAFVGFVGVTGDGQQQGSAEIVLQTGIVPAVDRTP